MNVFLHLLRSFASHIVAVIGSNAYTFIVAFANCSKKGVHTKCTDSGELEGKQIVVGFYDEEKGQTSGSCKKAVLASVEYVIGISY